MGTVESKLINNKNIYIINNFLDEDFYLTYVLPMVHKLGFEYLKENFIIKCQENKMVVFDSRIEHSAVAQTDTDQRVVINFNGF